MAENKIFNPFSNQIVNLGYGMIVDFSDDDKALLKNVLSRKNNEIKDGALKDLLYRNIVLKNPSVTTSSINQRVNHLYGLIEQILEKESGLIKFKTEDGREALLTILEEVLNIEKDFL